MITDQDKAAVDLLAAAGKPLGRVVLLEVDGQKILGLEYTDGTEKGFGALARLLSDEERAALARPE